MRLVLRLFAFAICFAFSCSFTSVNAAEKPLLILVSADGFRFGLQWKVPTPNLDRLRSSGTEAFPGMIPVYPTLTFPNHYSIATGLYPAWHGIIANRFRVRNPATNSFSTFTKTNYTTSWWLGEPIWETVMKSGRKAAVYFWPGGEVLRSSWKCPASLCPPFNDRGTPEMAINATLGFVDMPDRPILIATYLNLPDKTEHNLGPDGPQIDAAVAKVDAAIGKLLDGLKQRRILHKTTVIMLGDHGFTSICSSKLVFLEDLAPWGVYPTEDWFDWEWYRSPVVGLTPPAGADPADLVKKMNAGLSSGKVTNGEYLKFYLKEDLPARLHYSQSDRIPPIVGLPAEGYEVAIRRTNTSTQCECAGDHGFDNMSMSMRTIFIGSGPRFYKGKQVPSFENVEVYNIIAEILGLKGAPTNGTRGFPDKILIPKLWRSKGRHSAA